MATEAVLSPGPLAAMSEDDLMSDFVVLSASPQEKAYVMTGNGVLDDLHLSLPSGGSEISLEDAEHCITELLRENRELKEVLAQNTATLRSQYDNFAGWQKQLQEANENRRRILENLQSSNASLSRKKEDLEARLAESDKRLASIQGRVEELDKQLEEERRAAAEWEAKAMTERLQHVSKEEELVSSFEPVPGLVPNAGGSPVDISEVLVQLHQEQTKTAEQSEQIDRLNQEMAKLNKEFKEKTEEAAELKTKLSQAEARKTELGYHESARFAQLEASLLEKEAVTRALQDQCTMRATEVNELRHALLQAEQRHEKAKTDYAQLLKTWQEFESSSAGEQSFVRVEASAAASARLELEEARKEAQEHARAAAEKERQLTALKTEKERLQQELEVLPQLQAQLDLFRADYGMEKELRIGLEARVNEQRGTIQELQELLAGLQIQAQETGRLPEIAAEPAQSAANVSTVVDSNLACPLCGHSCATRSAYITHVQSCANAEDNVDPWVQ